MARLERLVIHCAATKAGQDFKAADVVRWHTDPKPRGNGWRVPGYADVIELDGSLVNLVPYNADDYVDPWEVTNGVYGYNASSRHICYIGGLDSAGKTADTRTPEQTLSMLLYILYLVKFHPDIEIVGHGQLANKDCPSFDVPTWLRAAGLSKYAT